jgi:hypothetical protein
VETRPGHQSAQTQADAAQQLAAPLDEAATAVAPAEGIVSAAQPVRDNDFAAEAVPDRVSATEPGPEPAAVPGSSSAVPATAPALEPRAVPPVERRFDVAGVEWIARVAGGGAGGTGRLGLAGLEAIRFYAADAPDRALREALVGGGQLDTLFEEELRRMWQRARVLENPPGGGR